MKILLSSYSFAPAVGGLETVSHLLAREFQALGHQVIVATETSALPSGEAERSFEVYRRPTASVLARLVRWSDISFHNNITLSGVWPLLSITRPWVIAHQTWLPDLGEPAGLRGRLKRLMLRLAAANVSISRAIADSLNVSSDVIGNPYDDSVFVRLSHIERVADLIYVGRLVPDKGVDVMLRALAILASQGKRPVTTIVGDGPSRAELEAMTARLGLSGNVTFVGTKMGGALAELLNQHKIMVVPSKWEEPFGIVALEGIACGCMVLAARSGGLPEAVGPCGKIFLKNDHAALADDLALLLSRPELMAPYRAQAGEHLCKHFPQVVAERYLEVFRRALSDRGEKPEL